MSSSPVIHQGFVYAATDGNGKAKTEADYRSDFAAAKRLANTKSAFSSARIFTVVQPGTTASISAAVPAAIQENTSLLLGLWVSGGSFTNELSALKAAISAHGKKLADLVVGIAVGSEDLYRIAAPSAGAGATPTDIVSYIRQVRDSIKGSVLDGVPVGHVDLSSAWTNSSNREVIDACDFLGVNIYPYYEDSGSNRIEDAKSLYKKAAGGTLGAARNKPVWITETGWPVRGPTHRDAVPSTSNAENYWREVGCSMFGVENTWWFTLETNVQSSSTVPDFGISDTSNNAAFDLSCPATSSTTSTASQSPSIKSSARTGGSSQSQSQTSTSTSATGSTTSTMSTSGPASQTSSDVSEQHSNTSQSLSAGAKAGIAVGVIAGLLVLFLAAFLWRKRRASRQSNDLHSVDGIEHDENAASRGTSTFLAGAQTKPELEAVPVEITGTNDQGRPVEVEAHHQTFSSLYEADSRIVDSNGNHEMSSSPSSQPFFPVGNVASISQEQTKSGHFDVETEHEMSSTPAISHVAMTAQQARDNNVPTEDEVATMKKDLEAVRAEQARLKHMWELETRERELSRAIVQAELQRAGARAGNLP